MTPKRAPRIATWMLKHFGCGPNIDAILGDLAEQYQEKNSAIWYWRQAMTAVPVSFFREIRAHKRIAATALVTGWAAWIFSLMWFFPFVSRYFFGNGLGVEFSPTHPIGSARSLAWMPVGASFSVNQPVFGDVSTFVFAIVLPLIVAANCGWVVACFHRNQQRAAVLLFAGSVLIMDLLFFGSFVFDLGFWAASLFLRPLAVYVAASVLGILIGGGLFVGSSRTASD